MGLRYACCPRRVGSITTLLLMLVGARARADEPPPSPSTDVAPADTSTSLPPAPSPPAVSEPPLAGWHDGLFYIRDREDIFRLYVQGRVHVDGVAWIGPGVGSLGPDVALRPTLFLRRARPELAGEFFHDWQWQLSVDLAPTATDNGAGRTDPLNCTVDPATGAETCSPQTNPVQAPIQKPAPTDVFVNYAPSPWFNIQVGQFLLPFTMENRISDNTTPFLERSLVVRNVGAPFTRDIGAMLWGEAPSRHIYYSAGIYNGDGPNRQNADNRFDYVARVFARPLADAHESPLRDAQVGVSGRYGSRDAKLVGYDMPTLTTQGGYGFWKPTYRDSLGRTMHIIPSAEQGAVGFDAYVPVDGVDLAGEVVYAISNTREAADGYQLSPFTERTGVLKGYGYYVEAGVWLVGGRDIIGFPSAGKPLHADLKSPEKPARHGLEVLAKFEQLALTYDGASRGGVLDSKTPNGDIRVTAATFGVNYWATRHLRVALNYGFYLFPDSAPVTPSEAGGPVQSSVQRAVAPGQNLAKGVDNSARDSNNSVNEISFRFGVQF
jgi:hypothetical protein